MSRLRFLLICSGILALLGPLAHAADMPGTTMPPPPQWLAPQIIDVNSGWYLREDFGYAWGRIDGATSTSGYASPHENKLDDGMSGGVGVGFRSRWLRADLTLDYLTPLKYTGGIVQSGDVVARISAISALFNGYLDLGTWYQVTPYIGAGAGIANVNVDDAQSSVAPPFSSTSRNQWNFAWAAMAGLGYPLTRALMLDISYRYLNLGDVSTGSDAFGSMTFNNVAAQEIRFGLRWNLDDWF